MTKSALLLALLTSVCSWAQEVPVPEMPLPPVAPPAEDPAIPDDGVRVAILGYHDLATISRGYEQAAQLVAEADLAAVARRSTVADMAETVVIGTVLGDRLSASLRRIAQESVSNQTFPTDRSAS